MSEFYVTNYTMEEFLNTNVITRFEETLSMVYQQEGAAVTKIINPLERGILVPPPPAKHGYVVRGREGRAIKEVWSRMFSNWDVNSIHCSPCRQNNA